MAASILTLSRLVLFSFVVLSTRWAACNVIVGTSENTDRDRQWEAWKFWHGKTYPSAGEEAFRRKVWENNMAAIFTHNAAGRSFKMAMNSLGDQESTSHSDKIGLRTNRADADPDNLLHQSSMDGAPPLHGHLDWRDKGVVTPVKNQGMGGKVMAYAMTEALESYHAIWSYEPRPHDLVQLSVQEVADCCPDVELSDGFDCIINKTKGLCSAADYPPRPIGQCKTDMCSAVATCQSTGHVMLDWPYMVGWVRINPIVVKVDASLTSFQMYSSGIYDDPQCSSAQLDHALVVVGYGSSGGVDYWICRNSWGVNWGEAGYIRIVLGKNMCGIAEDAFSPAP